MASPRTLSSPEGARGGAEVVSASSPSCPGPPIPWGDPRFVHERGACERYGVKAMIPLKCPIAPLLWAMLLMSVMAGCRHWTGAPWPDLADQHLLDFSDNSSAEDIEVDQKPGDASQESAGDSAQGEIRAVLAGDGWIETVASDNKPLAASTSPPSGSETCTTPTSGHDAHDRQPSPRWRWRYPALDDLLARPVPQRPDFDAMLEDDDIHVASNSAIALARLGEGTTRKQLAETVRTPTLSLPMRCAAAEALGMIERPSPVKELRKLIAQYGEFDNDTASHPIPELHAELIRGLVRHVDPNREPCFLDAVRSRSALVRLAAVESLGYHPEEPLPEVALSLRGDSDPRIRASVLERLAASGHPEACRYLTEALRDFDVGVQMAAIRGLGTLSDEEAIKQIEELLSHRAESIRVSAVAAMAMAGRFEQVFEAAEDDSWRVRREVAKALGSYPSRRSAALAVELLVDRSAEVQEQVVDSIRKWPLADAGPVLLHAMNSTSYRVREAASLQLADRWKPAAGFPRSGTDEERQAALQSLKDEFRRCHGPAVMAAPGRTDSGKAAALRPAADAALGDRVSKLIEKLDAAGRSAESREPVVDELLGLGSALPAALENLLFEQRRRLPESLWRDVLPKHDPIFEYLARLRSDDLMTRRRTASDLAKRAREEGISRLAVFRLAEIVTPEPDQLVWQSALSAIDHHASEPAVRLAYAGVTHTSPEVRRRACQYLETHAGPEHADILLPVLEDESDQVVVAAVRALGAGDKLDNLAPLYEVMRTGSDTLRLEVAVALIRLGDKSGLAGLERLAYSGDPHVRREAASAMGRAGDPAFVPVLIQMLDDHQSVRRAALATLPLVVGRDVAEETSPEPQNMTERIERWRSWYRGLQAGVETAADS